MRTFRCILWVTFVFGLAETAMSQDVILKKDNTTVLSKVLEVTSTEIKYKKWTNQGGPTYTISSSDVLSINYQNGEVQHFNSTVEPTPVEPIPVEPTPVPQQEIATISIDESQAAQPEPEKPKSPYSRSRVQFSLTGGVAFPLGKFGKTDEKEWSVPFAFDGDDLETGFGAAKTGFNVGMGLYVPLFKANKNIVGMPIKFNLLYNGLTDTEKKDYRDYMETLSNFLNEYYGTQAYSYKITKYPNYMNYSLSIGVDYTHYFVKAFALFFEGDIGLNIAHISKLELQNSLGETYITTIDNVEMYSEARSVYKYNPKATFMYEVGAGLFVANHVSLGVYYTGYTPYSVSSKRIYSGKTLGIDDLTEDYTAPKIKISALSVRFGVHF